MIISQEHLFFTEFLSRAATLGLSDRAVATAIYDFCLYPELYGQEDV